MRRQTALFGVLGTLSTLFGVALWVAPEGVRSVGILARWLTAVERLDSTALLLVSGLLVVGYVSLFARSRPGSGTATARSAADRRFETAGTSPPEAMTAASRAVTAAGLDADLDAAVDHGGNDLDRVREELRTLAADLYTRATGEPADAARQAVEDGTWTRDDVAGAFLSAGDDVSVRARLALWLRPGRERRRRLERTISALERLQGQA